MFGKIEKRPATIPHAGRADEMGNVASCIGAKPSYEEVAHVVARYVYNVWYHEETWADQPVLKTFNTLCSPALRVSARVLIRLDILRPLDESAKRNYFVCEPSEFKERARANRSTAHGFDTLVLAAIALAEYDGPREAGLLSCLIRLGLCKPIEFKTKVLAASGIKVTDFELIWTSRIRRYDCLREHWGLRLVG